MPARAAKTGRPRIPPRPAPDEAGVDARERIIRTAYELFTQNGLAAVGVDRIVAEAGVAKTTLYRHFRSKDDLIAEVLERHHQLWLQDWLEPETRKHSASPADRLVAVFETVNEWFGDNNFQGCLLINSLLEAHDRSSIVRDAANRAIDDVYVFLSGLQSRRTPANRNVSPSSFTCSCAGQSSPPHRDVPPRFRKPARWGGNSSNRHCRRTVCRDRKVAAGVRSTDL